MKKPPALGLICAGSDTHVPRPQARRELSVRSKPSTLTFWRSQVDELSRSFAVRVPLVAIADEQEVQIGSEGPLLAETVSLVPYPVADFGLAGQYDRP